MNDLARSAAAQKKDSIDREVVRTMAAICQPRPGAEQTQWEAATAS
jgi:hypothetical protein